nr:MAG TPA: hypothetical protein [Caudoviricetes sp.]
MGVCYVAMNVTHPSLKQMKGESYGKLRRWKFRSYT